MSVNKGNLFLGLLVLLVAEASAQEANTKQPPALPEPLTLEYALELVKDQHPSLQRMDAGIQQALAGKQIVQTSNNLEVKLQGQARWIEPATRAPDQSHDDHQLGIIASKTLYDFGRHDSVLTAAEYDVATERLRYQQALQQHRIEVMRRFFDVLLADLQFFRYNEEMAVAYIQWDRKKERRRLNQAIDVDVLELETEYQKIRRLRYHSEAMQRQTRARLAAILNRPGQLPSTLAKPDLPILQQKLPELEQLQQLAMQHNLELQGLRQRIEAAQLRLLAARSAYDPTITGLAEAYTYTRDTGSSDTWRAGVNLDIPLYSGNRSDAVQARAKAEEYRLRAELREQEYNVAQAVLETWLKIDTLRVQRQEMKTRASYEETALDQSRALYELEIKADLGKSMVRVSEAEYLVKQTDYEMAIAWERLNLLTGRALTELPIKPATEGETNE